MVGISYTSTGGRKKRERIVQKEGRKDGAEFYVGIFMTRRHIDKFLEDFQQRENFHHYCQRKGQF